MAKWYGNPFTRNAYKVEKEFRTRDAVVMMNSRGEYIEYTHQELMERGYRPYEERPLYAGWS